MKDARVKTNCLTTEVQGRRVCADAGSRAIVRLAAEPLQALCQCYSPVVEALLIRLRNDHPEPGSPRYGRSHQADSL
jgi:hypothetical protein